MLGAVFFLLVFVLIAPQSRGFIGGLLRSALDHLANWGISSFLVILVLIFAPLFSFILIRMWPKRKDPPNPMAKYRAEEMNHD